MPWALGHTTAYMLPGLVVWAAIGWLLGPLGGGVGIAAVALAYALFYGLAETAWLPVRPPSLQWGVPAAWVRTRGQSAKAVIWGSALGPGILTRNPYAGMGLLPLVLVMTGSARVGLLAGALAGAAHGAAQAAGVMYNVQRCPNPHAVMAAIARWRLADGVALLAVAGVLLVLIP